MVAAMNCWAMNMAGTSTSGHALAHDPTGIFHQQSVEIHVNMERTSEVLQEAMRQQRQTMAAAVARRLQETG